MGVLKNDVGRPSNKTIMIRNILKLIGVLLFAGLVVFFAYTYGKNEADNKQKKDNLEVKEEVISNEDAIKIIENFFGEDYKYVFQYDLNDENYRFATAFGETKALSKDFDLLEEYKGDLIKTINPLIENTDLEYDYKETSYYVSSKHTKIHSYVDILSAYKKLYGNNQKLDKKNYYFLASAYVYSKSADGYIDAVSVWGDGGYDEVAFVKSASKKGDYIYINVEYARIDAGLEVNPLPKTIEELDGIKSKYDIDVKSIKLTFKIEDGIYKLIKSE